MRWFYKLCLISFMLIASSFATALNHQQVSFLLSANMAKPSETLTISLDRLYKDVSYTIQCILYTYAPRNEIKIHIKDEYINKAPIEAYLDYQPIKLSKPILVEGSRSVLIFRSIEHIYGSISINNLNEKFGLNAICKAIPQGQAT